jgi:hypothetical protein
MATSLINSNAQEASIANELGPRDIELNLRKVLGAFARRRIRKDKRSP